MHLSLALLTGVALAMTPAVLTAGVPEPALTNKAKAKPSQTNAAPAVHTVSKNVLKTKTQLDAVFESTVMEPVKLTPKAWMDLTVLEAVPHGSKVKKGDVLVKLDLEKIREQIEDLELDKPGTKLGYELAQIELENLKSTTPMRLDSAKRSHKQFEEDYQYYADIGKAQREKLNKFMLKNAEQRLEYTQEELKQLEKMYKADELTEETEEIILKRQRFMVEAAKFSYDNARLFSEREAKIFMPREAESWTIQRKEQDLSLALAEQNLPRTLTKKTLDFEKMKRDQKKSDRRFTDLKNDLEKMSVEAPVDGMVYYGACENGKWTSGAVVAKKLVPNGKLMPNEVFMTIINPEKLQLRTVISEAELGKFKAGMKGTATPVSFPDKKLNVTLEEIGYIPQPGGGFEATMSVKQDKSARVMPGMNCKVTFTESAKGKVITVPKESLSTEGEKSYVYLAKGEKPEKHEVKTGESDTDSIEITEGLETGDKILRKNPDKQEKADKAAASSEKPEAPGKAGDKSPEKPKAEKAEKTTEKP